MTIVIILCLVFFVLFTFVIAFGAPFLPTLTGRVDDALELLDLQSGQTLLELGSGDGRLLRAAAARGIHAVGYELNPILVLWSKLLSMKYKGLVTVKLGNFWQTKWPEFDGVYVFLLNPYMTKLDTRLIQESKDKNIKLVSFAFQIPDKKPKKEINGMFLYKYESGAGVAQ